MMQEVIIEIKDIAQTGQGVGTSDGLTIFVEGALPKEKVRVNILEQKRSFAKATILDIVETSKSRVLPICPLFGKCGGCQMMHFEYQQQIKVKQKRVIDAFLRIGKLKDFTVAACTPSLKPLHYRNKIQFGVDDQGFTSLHEKKSSNLLRVQKCYIQGEDGCKIVKELPCLKGVRNLLIRTSKKGEGLITLVAKGGITKEIYAIAKQIYELKQVVGVFFVQYKKEDNFIPSDAYRHLFGKKTLKDEILGISVEISPSSFFQVNVDQAEQIYKKAFEISDLKEGETVLDAYSGSGLFTIYLAKKNICVTGIEVVESSVTDSKKNALLNGVKVNFLHGRAEDLIQSLDRLDVIFLNPPRSGCVESVLKAAVSKNPRSIIYTSCDAATLARDLNILKNLGYGKVEAYPFDMFPQTMHVEIVAKIQKGESV